MSWSKERSKEEQRFIRRKCNQTSTLSNTAKIVGMAKITLTYFVTVE